MWVFIRIGEVINGLLGKLVVVIDDFTKLPAVLRILRIGALLDLHGVLVVAGKNNGLAKFIAPFDLQALRHQRIQYLVDRI